MPVTVAKLRGDLRDVLLENVLRGDTLTADFITSLRPGLSESASEPDVVSLPVTTVTVLPLLVLLGSLDCSGSGSEPESNSFNLKFLVLVVALTGWTAQSYSLSVLCEPRGSRVIY